MRDDVSLENAAIEYEVDHAIPSNFPPTRPIAWGDADELTPSRGVPHLGEMDKTLVHADLWSADGTTMIRFSFVVSHVGESVHHVEFEQGWRLMLGAIGEDSDDSDVHGWLAAEAKRAFRRRP